MPTITYNASSPFGAKIATIIRDVKEAQQLLARCVDVANNLTNGGQAGSLSLLEGSAQFGIGAGQGTAFYNAIASLNASLFANIATRTPLQASIDLDQGQ